MKKLSCLILFLNLTAGFLSAQGVINEQAKTLLTNEQTVSVFLNSNGFGFDYRYGKYINYTNRRIFELNFNYVKDPKEYKTVKYFTNYNSYTEYIKRFVYGKENLFWEIQGLIGNEREIYQKYDYSSISIRMFYEGGISLGFLKPIYYEILISDNQGYWIDSEYKPFDPSIHQYNYGGNAPFSYGLRELKLIPGITAKTGFSFEYSEREPLVHALDLGLGLTAYPRNINIMSAENKQFIFFKMSVAYRFGNMIDISDAAKAKSKKERRKELRDARQQDAQKVSVSRFL